MPLQLPVRVMILAGEQEQTLQPLLQYLRSTRQVIPEMRPSSHLPGDLDHYQGLVLANPTYISRPDQKRLKTFVERGGGCLAFISCPTDSLPILFGAQAGPSHPAAELRLTFCEPFIHDIALRLPQEFCLKTPFLPLQPADGRSRPLLTTSWHYRNAAVALLREEGKGRVCSVSPSTWEEPLFHQVIYRIVRFLCGLSEPQPLGVAVLGYGPLGSMGSLHGAALREIEGLSLISFCDSSPERLSRCREDFPECKTYSRAEDLSLDPQVSAVIIATPPNTHAELALMILRAGKHVICEKPLCLSAKEAEAMMQTAEEQDRVLSCYQNRRWDADYLAIQRAVKEGLIGEPFYLETFAGGYKHPCPYWHSDRIASGGAAYDWGAHYVDWILNLLPGPMASVIGTRHKRVWYDVTNSDQIKIQILFADGREADFLCSDVAALRKPKWYMLGTEGAIVGHWRHIRVRELHPTQFYREEQVPVTETASSLILRRRDPAGLMLVQDLPLIQARRFSFHLNLADHLLTGEPLAVEARSAARVVSVLEAATRSAEKGGKPEVLHG